MVDLLSLGLCTLSRFKGRDEGEKLQAFQAGSFGVAAHLTVNIPNPRIHFRRYHICIPLEASLVRERYYL